MTNDQQAIARITELAMRGQLDAAELACRELLAQAPQEHRAWAWLGMLALAKSQPAQAEQALRQAVGLYPHDARYWHPLSAALRMLGKPAEAETAARSALDLSDTGEHWASLANCLFDQRRQRETMSGDERVGSRAQALVEVAQRTAGEREHGRGRAFGQGIDGLGCGRRSREHARRQEQECRERRTRAPSPPPSRTAHQE